MRHIVMGVVVVIMGILLMSQHQSTELTVMLCIQVVMGFLLIARGVFRVWLDKPTLVEETDPLPILRAANGIEGIEHDS